MALLPASGLDPDLGKRALSGVVLGVVALAEVAIGGWWFASLVIVAVLLMAREWAGLAANVVPLGRAVIIAASIVFPVWAVLLTMQGAVVDALLLLALAAMLAASVTAVLVPHGITRAGSGVLYLGLPAVALVWLRADPDHGRAAILWLLIVVWTTDVMAYLVGRRVGGPKLAPRISPGKTWSGLAGGVAGAAILGGLFAWLFAGQAIGGAALASLLAIVAQAGDLFESWVKRVAGVKDSGRLIPGHGGILDRVDGLLFAAPVFAVVIALVSLAAAR